jgi:hypothetical protein
LCINNVVRLKISNQARHQGMIPYLNSELHDQCNIPVESAIKVALVALTFEGTTELNSL